MKPKQLAEIKAQCEAATEGPWHENFSVTDGSEIMAADSAVCCIREGCTERGYANMRFIASSRTDFPTCIEEIEQLENKLRWIKAEICSDNSEGNKLNRIRKALEQE